MKNFETIDGNEAVARVAFQLNEVVALFPITPASPMGEWADAWAAAGVKNLWGTVPAVIEMQSEGGAAGAIHGALQTGALSTTFTASQGLLLMIPNMYKIVGELTPFVLHVAARSVAAHSLSIFGDHSDVMAARTTGFALLCAASVQEAQDFTLIAHAATLESRIPFLFFFDGFRTSHEISKIEPLAQGTLRAMMNEERVREHRERALSPDHPVVRGTAQNPDVFFQAREGANRFHDACPGIVQRAMDSFTELTGRPYHLFDYHGANDAERLIVLMGSGCEAVHETVDYLNRRGERVGVLKVRLFRPWSARAFLEALPETVQSIAVLDRTKEPGSGGEPLYLDCVNTLYEAGRTALPIVGGRYGFLQRNSLRRWSKPFSIIWRRQLRRTTLPSEFMTMSQERVLVSIPLFQSRKMTFSGRSSLVSDRMVQSVPTRNRSRSLEKTQITTRRLILCTIPKRPGP